MSDIKKIFLYIFLILTVISILYLDYQIKIFNPTFYKGKVNGELTRFVTTIILSTLFYVISDLESNQKLIHYLYAGIKGFVIGVIFGILCHIIMGIDNQIIYQFITIIICYMSYYGLRKIKSNP